MNKGKRVLLGFGLILLSLAALLIYSIINPQHPNPGEVYLQKPRYHESDPFYKISNEDIQRVIDCKDMYVLYVDSAQHDTTSERVDYFMINAEK